MLFRDRNDGGRQLATLLRRFEREAPIVLALPRGGVPVGYEVARALHAPLDVVVVRKIGAPMMPELAVGAVAEGGVTFVDWDIAGALGLTPTEVGTIASAKRAEIEERVQRFRDGRPLPSLADRVAILVDDGIATGATARAAARAVRDRAPKRLVLAAPVAAAQSVTALESEVDEVVCVDAPLDFMAVGAWYDYFPQVSDEEVVEILGHRRAELAGQAPEQAASATVDPVLAQVEHVEVPAGEKVVAATLELPRSPRGAVVVVPSERGGELEAHERYVAKTLRDEGFAVLRFEHMLDLEEAAGIVGAAVTWLTHDRRLHGLRIGVAGQGLGGAVALTAAARDPVRISAVAIQGARTDAIAGELLETIRAPVLFIVGGRDLVALQLNRAAAARLPWVKEVAMVPGVSDSYDEPGAMAAVARLAAAWFDHHLAQPAAAQLRLQV